MANPNWLKHLAQLVITTGEVVVRAFSKALREEINECNQFVVRQFILAGKQAAARQAETTGESKAQTQSAENANLKFGISLQESAKILNVDPRDPLEPAEIRKKYEHLFAVNDKKKGGSLYLQSKVVRAKERIDEELKAQGFDVEEEMEKSAQENIEKSDNKEKEKSETTTQR